MHRSHCRTLFDLVDDTFQLIAFGTMKRVFRAPRFVELNHDEYHWLTARGTYRAIDRLWYHRDATPACQWLPGSLAAVASRIATWGQRQLPRLRRKHYRTPSHRRLEDRSAAGDGIVYAAIEQITNPATITSMRILAISLASLSKTARTVVLQYSFAPTFLLRGW